MKILLIEDNPGDARLIEEALRSSELDMELLWEKTLQSGLESLENGDVDVVLLDLSLPDSHGLDTLSLTQARSSAPIVVLSGLDDEDLALRAVNEGAQDYLIKGRVDEDAIARSIQYSLQRHQALQELRRQALMDELTGLYNRRGFEIHAEYYCKLAARENRDLVLLFIDLDNMKSINDTLGHVQGDRALADAAGILTTAFRDSDILGRVGGDEFSVLLTGQHIDQERAVERLREAVTTHNTSMDRPYQLSLSIGSATYDADAPRSLDELMQAADEDMYNAKVSGRGRRRVLLVDDDLSILLLGDIMFGDDYDVLTAESATDALAVAAQGQPDIILLDQSLPGMKGTDVVRKLRAEKNDVPIIMVTGADDAMTEVEALEAGADDYVSKPFHEKALRARVETVLRRRRR